MLDNLEALHDYTPIESLLRGDFYACHINLYLFLDNEIFPCCDTCLFDILSIANIAQINVFGTTSIMIC